MKCQYLSKCSKENATVNAMVGLGGKMLRCRVGLKWIHELYFGMMMTKAVNLTKKSPNDSGLMTSGHHVGGSSICCGKNQC